MALTDKSKYLLAAIGILVLLYLLNKSCKPDGFSNTKYERFTSEATPKVESEVASEMSSAPMTETEVMSEIPVDTSSEATNSEIELPTEKNEDDATKSKFTTKNSAHGKYKRFNYVDGSRGGAAGEEVDAFYHGGNDFAFTGMLANDQFVGVDEGNKYSSVSMGPKKPLSDQDKFTSENYLPQETNADWFEVVPEPISVKNRHLINVSRPIGVNTIGTSLRNPSYDLRGSPPCPKYVVSPWMQSTIEPDYNLRNGLC